MAGPGPVQGYIKVNPGARSPLEQMLIDNAYKLGQGWIDAHNDFRAHHDPRDIGIQGRELSRALTNLQSRLDKALSAVQSGNFTDQDKQLLLNAINRGQETDLQALDETLASRNLQKEQNTKLENFRNNAETQMFGKTGATLEEALSNPNSELGALASVLGKQQHDIFQDELAPLLRRNLAAQGIDDSGAAIELNAKALADLERNRQDRLLETYLGDKENLRGINRADVLGDIGFAQQTLNNQFDLQRTGISMQFQRDLEARREELARELSSYKGGSNTLNQILGGTMAAGSIAMAPMTGGASLSALPGSLSMALGDQGGGQAGAGLYALGNSYYGTRKQAGGGSTLPKNPNPGGYQLYGPGWGSYNNTYPGPLY